MLLHPLAQTVLDVLRTLNCDGALEDCYNFDFTRCRELALESAVQQWAQQGYPPVGDDDPDAEKEEPHVVYRRALQDALVHAVGGFHAGRVWEVHKAKVQFCVAHQTPVQAAVIDLLAWPLE